MNCTTTVSIAFYGLGADGTYSLVIKANESLENLGDDGRPCGNVFGLRIEAQLVEVLQDTQSQSIIRLALAYIQYGHQ